MVKKILLLLIITLIFSGCSIKELNNDNFDIVIDTILKDGRLTNTVARGYKYYIPNGVKLIESTNYNEKLYYNGDYYYLYVDIVGYYYNTEYDYELNDSAMLSRKIKFEDKTGYVEINEIEGIYFIEALYNHSRIEAFVNEKNLKDSFLNIMYLLSSVKFNDYVADLMLSDSQFNFNEEKYDIFKSKRKNGSFLDYINEYNEYNESINLDDIDPIIGNQELEVD